MDFPSIVTPDQWKPADMSLEIFIDNDDLENWLPHAKIAKCLNWVRYEGRKNAIGHWTPSAEYFTGHFGILPGHWIGESACLAAAVLGQLIDKNLKGTIPLMEYTKVFPQKTVRLGDALTHFVGLKTKNGRTLSFEFVSKNLSDTTVATGECAGKAVPLETFKKMLARMPA